MITVEFIDDAIEFLENDFCFYDLTISEIHRHGVDFWLNHLSFKNWFAQDVKAKFLSLINEHTRI